MKTKQQYHKIKIGKEENKNYNTNYIEKQKNIKLEKYATYSKIRQIIML